MLVIQIVFGFWILDGILKWCWLVVNVVLCDAWSVFRIFLTLFQMLLMKVIVHSMKNSGSGSMKSVCKGTFPYSD